MHVTRKRFFFGSSTFICNVSLKSILASLSPVPLRVRMRVCERVRMRVRKRVRMRVHERVCERVHLSVRVRVRVRV